MCEASDAGKLKETKDRGVILKAGAGEQVREAGTNGSSSGTVDQEKLKVLMKDLGLTKEDLDDVIFEE